MKRTALVVALGAMAACSAPQGASVDGIHDPYEQTNRATHAFNKGLDRALLRPASNGYDAVLPDPVQTGVSNFASNLALPGTIVNNLLQADLHSAGQNTTRFFLNTTLGIGGLFDPAGAANVPAVEADFGQTLAVWGVREGAYVELPFIGPSTERDTVGTVVDVALNPLSYILQHPEAGYATGARAGKVLDTRSKLGSTIDDVLYNSADSYAQSRLIYLQNRRFELGEDTGDAYVDPYIDPYEDLPGG